MNHANEEEKHSSNDIGQTLSKYPIKEVNESFKSSLNCGDKNQLKFKLTDKKVIKSKELFYSEIF